MWKVSSVRQAMLSRGYTLQDYTIEAGEREDTHILTGYSSQGDSTSVTFTQPRVIQPMLYGESYVVNRPSLTDFAKIYLVDRRRVQREPEVEIDDSYLILRTPRKEYPIYDPPSIEEISQVFDEMNNQGYDLEGYRFFVQTGLEQFFGYNSNGRELIINRTIQTGAFPYAGQLSAGVR